MKKFLIVFLSILFVFLSWVAYRTTFGKPPLVEEFLCSDYCPPPEEQYLKSIYEGVSNKIMCRLMGGKPHTYYGWREYTVCLARSLDLPSLSR